MWKKKIYISDSAQPFRLNRTKIDLFFDCERCFVLDQKFGIKRPFGTPLVMNNKIVNTLKDELEICREKRQIHPQVLENNLNYIPNNFELLNDWKNPFKGVKYIHKKTNFLLNGSIDDIWINKNTKKNFCLIIKSTSKKEQLSYEQIWSGYWRQLSFYTYLLEKNSVEMSNTGIIVFIKTFENSKKFSKSLSFNLSIFEKILDLDWIEPTLENIYKILNRNEIPKCSNYCKYCKYYFNIKNKIDG